MHIIKIIFLVSVLVVFVNNLAHKWGVFDWLGRLANRFKFFYNLVHCEFCMNFHFSWILTIVVLQFFTFEPIYYLVPFCVSGFLRILE